jgi:IS66 C-terminal element
LYQPRRHAHRLCDVWRWPPAGLGRAFYPPPNVFGGAHTVKASETNGANLTSALSTAAQFDVAPKAPVITAVIGQPDASVGITVKGTGLCLFTKRIDRGNFFWQRLAEPGASVTLSPAQLESRKLNDVGPYAYPHNVLSRMVDGYPINRLDELLPWAWKTANPVKS